MSSAHSKFAGALWALAATVIALILLRSLREIVATPKLSITALLVLLGAAVIAVLMLWIVPCWQVARLTNISQKERFELEDKARTTLAQIGGGIILLVGSWMTLQDLGIKRESEFTDRFAKAIDQLGEKGKEKMSVRLGAIYALDRIAREDKDEHWHIMNVLVADVREETSTKRRCYEDKNGMRPCPDVETALSVVARRNRSFDPTDDQNLDLSTADLEGAYLNGLDLSHIVFWKANLSGTQLVRAKLNSAFFRDADLTRANLEGAHLEWAHFENLSSQSVLLNGANLSDAYLDGTCFHNLDLTHTKGLKQEQIDKAKGDKTTSLPAGIHVPDRWVSDCMVQD